MTDQDQDAFPRLGEAEISSLATLGSRRAVASGEYLYREGDVAYDFFVVLSGAAEIVVGVYVPKGGDLSRYRRAPLATIAEMLNERPRETLAWRSPAEAYAERLAVQ
jgi:CRP-like cAMP-binding protein